MSSPVGGNPAFYNTQWWEGVLSALTGSTGISGMKDLTQEAVMAAKGLEIQANEVLSNLLGIVFDGLRGGISFALAIIESIAVKLFGLIPGFEHVEDALEAISEVPAVEAVVAAITGVAGTLDDVADFLAAKWTDVADAIGAIGALIAAVGGTVIGDVADAIAGAVAGAADAVADFANLLTGLSLGDTSALVTYLSNTATDASNAVNDLAGFLSSTGQASFAVLGAALNSLIAFLTSIPASLLSGALPTGLTVSGNPIGTLLSNLNSSGQFAASQLTGGINTAVTFGGTALSTLFQYLNGSGQFNAAQLTGAINTGLTFSGTALSTLLGNINSSGQFAASQLTGALNTAVTFGGTALSTVLQYITPSTGVFDAAHISGAFNTAVTIGGQAVSSIFNGSGQFIGVLNSAATGALNSAITYGGTALSTVLTNITASTGALNAAGLTGALNTAVTFSGTALSTLLGNLNSSGQFAANQLTGAINGAVTLGGVTLTNLLQNLNSSGQLVGSAITGAINTAATISGTALSTLSTNWNAAVTNVNSLITNAGSTIADVNTLINGAVTNAQGSLNAIVNGVNASALTGQTAAQAKTAIEGLVSGVVNNLQGLAGTFGLTGANAAYAASAATQAAAAAQLAAQQSAFNAVFNVNPTTAGNINITTDFTSKSNQSGMSGIMSPGSGTGTGYMGVSSGEVAWGGNSSGTNIQDFELFPTITTSDYQVIDITLGNLKDILGGSCATWCIFRANSARTTFLYAYLWGNGTSIYIELGAVVSGSITTFSTSAAITSIASGGALRVIAGDPSSSSPYALQVLYGGTPRVTYTDSSHVSQLGASYRYVGLAMSGGNSKYPAQIRTVTYQDNPPPPTAYPFSGRPTASSAAKGRMYVSSDCGRIDRDNGGTWENIYLGPLAWAGDVPTTGWSQPATMGPATVTADLDGRKFTAPSVAGDNWRLDVRTLSPTSNYTAAVYMELASLPGNFALLGLILRDSTSGKLIFFGITNNSGSGGYSVTVAKYNSPTSFSANYTTATLANIGGIPNRYRVRDDGTNRYCEYSFNGVDWCTFHTAGRTDFLTPNQIGWGVCNSSGNTITARLRSLAGVS